MTTVTLAAPGAFKSFSCQSGNSYTSDTNSIITSVASNDVDDLLEMGCTFPNDATQVRYNLSATTAPAATDDSSKGYGVGSIWQDVTNKQYYECSDATASAAVWNQLLSPGIVNVTAASLALTFAAHAGKTLTLNKADGIALTLPVAAGTGKWFDVVVGTTFSGGSGVIAVPDASGIIQGSVTAPDTDAAGTSKVWRAGASDDTITMNGVATGGKIGDKIRLTDYAANKWVVEGYISQSGGSEATPFSAAV